jgi:hypothetical protein
MILCVINSLRANVFNFVILVIKAFIVNSEFGLYIKLLSVKVYVVIFAKELIKIVYLSLILCIYNVLYLII